LKILIIAEKPSVARDIAYTLGKFNKKEGCLENDRYVISWAYGHITTLAEPQEYDPALEKWDLESLPILPAEFKLTVTERKQFSILKKLLNRKDVFQVINACDAGREGELIFRWIYRASGSTLPVKRLWLSETTPAAIREAMRNLKNGDSYDNLYRAAESRAIADWLIGINATRAFSVKHGGLLSIGRVQTPTLALVIQREREIRDFKPVPFWQVKAVFETETGQKYQGLGYSGSGEEITFQFKEEAAAKEYASRVKESGSVIKVQYTEKTEQPPALFNLNDLQREVNRVFGMTAAGVLEAAQNLYEKKLLTYPRTDSRHLTESLAGTLEKRIETALKTIPFSSFPEPLPALSKRYVDDSKVTDHHAIIPTAVPAPGDLPEAEKKVYDLVCRRFLSIFLPPAKYRVMEVTTEAGERFFSKGRAVVDRGWREIYNFKPGDGDKEARLPDLANGQPVKTIDVEVLRKETKPPARYTDASLLSAMENAGRYVDDKELSDTLKTSGGIGTPATRAAIIERLIQVGYIKRQKKALVPAAKGEALIDLVPGVLKSPDMTAEWETGLLRIERNEIMPGEWLSGIKNLTGEVVALARKQEKSEAVTKREVLGKCPLCGKDVIEGKKGYGCSGWKEGCKFVIWKEIAGKKITVKQAQALLEKKKTGLIKGFKSKSGKKFDAMLTVAEDGKIVFTFADIGSNILGKCPLCGKDVIESTKSYSCSGWKDGCKFTIWKEISGKKITVKYARNLLQKGATGVIKGFKSKSGKKFDAELVLKDGKVTFNFD